MDGFDSPTPLSDTERLQSDPAVLSVTMILPPRFLGNACLIALMIISVITRPIATALLDSIVAVPSTTTESLTSSVKDAARPSLRPEI
jgi:hypothetical protein